MLSEKKKDYLRQSIEYLIEDSKKAKEVYLSSQDNEQRLFNDGILMGYYYSIKLLQEQALLFELELKDLGFENFDPDKDLIG